jgi:hypothetical protein
MVPKILQPLSGMISHMQQKRGAVLVFVQGLAGRKLMDEVKDSLLRFATLL